MCVLGVGPFWERTQWAARSRRCVQSLRRMRLGLERAKRRDLPAERTEGRGRGHSTRSAESLHQVPVSFARWNPCSIVNCDAQKAVLGGAEYHEVSAQSSLRAPAACAGLPLA